jgi:hypothetical protein
MSVLKIADEIDDLLKEQDQLPWGTKQVYLDLAATIIRQQAEQINNLKQWEKRQLALIEYQQTEIEALKKQIATILEANARSRP